MTEKETIHKVMLLHAGNGLKDCPLGHLKPKDVWKWIDNMNEVLKDMPYYYLLTGDSGVVVVEKPQKEGMTK